MACISACALADLRRFAHRFGNFQVFPCAKPLI
jgi:hypothetical protein